MVTVGLGTENAGAVHRDIKLRDIVAGPTVFREKPIWPCAAISWPGATPARPSRSNCSSKARRLRSRQNGSRFPRAAT